MEEKVLITGEKNKKFRKIIIICGIVIYLIAILIDFLASSLDEDYIYMVCSVIAMIGIIFTATGIITIFIKAELVVTDKRVYGKTGFCKRVDLPIDLVSAVGTSWLWGIDIGTSSGRIHFKLMNNKDEIHSVLSKLLMERQQEKITANIQTASNADELKKYKDLLDNGAITQSEFDEKKKQLLSL